MNRAKLILAFAIVAPTLCAQSNGSISGVITNSLTGATIEGVRVHAGCFSPTCSEAPVPVVTNSAGAFHFSSLPAGRYLMSVEKDGFSTALPGLHLATVSDSKDAQFDAKLTPFARLQGRVVDPEGKPVAGITVMFAGRNATTDDQGVFVLQKLDLGPVRLWARVKPQPYGKDGERLVNTYYPSAIDSEQAVQIEVQGFDLSGYEIRLRTAPARSIRGVLLDASGKPIQHTSVELAKPSILTPIPMISGPFSPSMAQVATPQSWDYRETDADGVFEFPAVFEGDWILKGYGDSGRQSGAIEVRVGRSDIDNITLRTQESFPIEITPEWSDSESSDPPHVSVQVVRLDIQTVRGRGTDAYAPFTEHEQGLPGHYLFGRGQPSPGSYLSAAMLNGRDVLDQIVELSGPTTVKLIFKKDGGKLSGTVEKGGGATVILIAESKSYARFGRTVQCDADGNFSISDVPPGSYTAVAFRDHSVLAQPDVLTRIDSAHGERVKIEASSMETVTLSLN